MTPFSRRSLLAAASASGLLRASQVTGAELKPSGYRVTSTELFVGGLDPAHEGLRIAQLSDVHVGMNTPEARVLAAVREVNAAKPDLVFLTGDFVTYSARPLPRV